MAQEHKDPNGWFRYSRIGDVEKIEVFDKEKSPIRAIIWEESVTTGKQRVSAGCRTVVSFNGKKYESSIKHSSKDALMDLFQKMSIDGYQLMAWGVEEGFHPKDRFMVLVDNDNLTPKVIIDEDGYGYFKFPDGTQTDSVRAIAAKLSLEDFLALKAKKDAEEASIVKAQNESEMRTRHELLLLAQCLSRPRLRRVRNFGGAGVILTDEAPEIKDSGAYSSVRYVVTEYSQELSWFFDSLRDIFYAERLLNHISKIEFFGRLANSAIRYLEQNSKSNAHDLCASVVHEGFAIYEEIKAGNFGSLSIALGNEIVDDDVDESTRNGFVSIEKTYAFFKEFGIEIFTDRLR